VPLATPLPSVSSRSGDGGHAAGQRELQVNNNDWSPALRGHSLDVPKGETVPLMGANGAGRSRPARSASVANGSTAATRT